MAKFAADRRGLELPHAPQPVARRPERLRRRHELGPVQVLRHVPLVPRRLDRARARGDGVLRADGELLQALRRRRRGRRRASPGATTTAPPGSASSATGHSLRIECRIPGADCNPYLAFAAALASGLDGIAQPDRAARRASSATCMRRAHLPRVPTTLARRHRAFRAQRVREARPSATRWSSTTPTSSGPSRRRLRRRSPTGSAGATSSASDATEHTTRGQGRADHRRRQRHRT